MDTDDPPAGGTAVWLLIDDRAGNRSQCLGVAEALDLKFEIRDLEYAATGALPQVILGAKSHREVPRRFEAKAGPRAKKAHSQRTSGRFPQRSIAGPKAHRRARGSAARSRIGQA